METPKKILVVDDDTNIREVIHLVLEAEGYDIRELGDGHDIAGTIHSFQPDIILLDVMLGEMDGRDICRELKHTAETADIPIIMVSATHREEVIRDGDCRANDYLAKPFDIGDLIRKVGFTLPHNNR
ncbi:MAG: response regulator [Mucilaginibacter sp.]|nr:response regulator [Mucilaginibacter sp.]